MGLDAVGRAATIGAHSIIAARRDPPGAGGTDGLAPDQGAHLDGMASEFLAPSCHLCLDNPAAIREIRLVPVEHGVRRSSPGRMD